MDGKSTLNFKIMIFQDILFLLHDLYNTGQFYECTSISLGLGKEVLGKSEVGFTAIAQKGAQGISQTFTVTEFDADDSWDAHGDLPQSMWDGGDEHEPGVEPNPSGEESVEAQLEKMMLHEW